MISRKNITTVYRNLLNRLDLRENGMAAETLVGHALLDF
jgi:hypothetical protein